MDRDNDIARRLLWGGILAGVGAVASVVAHRVSAVIWRRIFKEEPPE